VSCGYASRICSGASALARKSRISDTQMRAPLMHGLPKQTFGSIEMVQERGHGVHMADSAALTRAPAPPRALP
jgi:hypothetical protein